MTETNFKIGIAGCGNMGTERAKYFAGLEGVSVAKAFSRSISSAEKLAVLVGAEPVDDYRKLLDSDLDAVVITAPNSCHYQMAAEALDAEKHVLIEYPLCGGSLTEATAMADWANNAGKVLMSGNTIIHERMFRLLKERCGELGDLLSISSRVALYDDGIAGSWYLNPSLRGRSFASFHYHHIEYCRRFLGDVEWVMGVEESRFADNSNTNEKVAGGSLMAGCEGNRTGTIHWYLIAENSGIARCFCLTGTKGSFTVISHQDRMSMLIHDGSGEVKTEEFLDEWGVSGSCDEFLAAVRGEMDWRQRLESDLATLKTALAVLPGQVVKVKDSKPSYRIP